MTLAPGTRLGPYEILAAIGAGGMGEVYHATDTNLKRAVAIKILPESVAKDRDRLARFQREAEVLASLNHSNIAAIYGLERSDGVTALVMELVEGPTLANRIAQGRIPLDEALPIAKQIAEALESAHEHGIIHRDLKPANIKLRDDGTVKVLDFGLAKAMEPTVAAVNVSLSPTITSPAMTRMGVILGTAAYMAPEQARGKTVDKRADIWAFGCVLFEMLTGKRVFDGEGLTDVIAAVVRDEPDWKALPADVPDHLRMLLKGCLEKERKARIGDIAVARFLLDQGSTLVSARPQARTTMPWIAGLAVLALAVGALIFWRPWQTAPANQAPRRFTAEIGADVSLVDALGASAILSPDGMTLVFVGAENTSNSSLSLYVRRLDQLRATPLPGTDGALQPFFSPDGKWIGFFSVGKLKKIAVTGGAVVTLCDAPLGRGGTWTDEGSIIFTPTSSPGTTLVRVSAEGGTPEKLLDVAKDEAAQRWPQALPGARAVIFTSAKNLGNFDGADIVAQPLPKGERKVLVNGGYYGRYVASGHLLYFRERTLFAAPFDLDRLEVTGPAVPAIEGARSNSSAGIAQFDVSRDGTLVYVAGGATADSTPIRWLDRSGQLSMMRKTPSNWSNPSFSPDGRLLAIDIHDGTQSDIWIYDWERDTLSRRTFDKSDDARPVWSPDGKRIAFASRRDGGSASNLYWQRADGTGDAERLTTSKSIQYPTSFHPSGRYLAFIESMAGQSDVMLLRIEGDEKTGWKPGTPTALLNAPYVESSAIFSPDGRWFAYLSNEGGRTEVFVQPFPGPGGKYQISSGAADDPAWSRTAPELFFLNTSDLRLMMMPYRVEGSTFIAGKPVQLSEMRILGRPRPPSRDLDLHPDGKRFVVAGADEGAQRLDRVVFVLNFFDELRRIAPPKNKNSHAAPSAK